MNSVNARLKESNQTVVSKVKIEAIIEKHKHTTLLSKMTQ